MLTSARIEDSDFSEVCRESTAQIDLWKSEPGRSGCVSAGGIGIDHRANLTDRRGRLTCALPNGQFARQISPLRFPPLNLPACRLWKS